MRVIRGASSTVCSFGPRGLVMALRLHPATVLVVGVSPRAIATAGTSDE